MNLPAVRVVALDWSDIGTGLHGIDGQAAIVVYEQELVVTQLEDLIDIESR